MRHLMRPAPSVQETSAQTPVRSRSGRCQGSEGWKCKLCHPGTLEDGACDRESVRKRGGMCTAGSHKQHVHASQRKSLQQKALSAVSPPCVQEPRAVRVPHLRGEPDSGRGIRVVLGKGHDSVEEPALAATEGARKGSKMHLERSARKGAGSRVASQTHNTVQQRRTARLAPDRARKLKRNALVGLRRPHDRHRPL